MNEFIKYDYNYKLILQNSNNGEVFDITELVGDITLTSELMTGQPEKLTFFIQEDPNKLLQISEGSIVSFSVNEKGIFFGYIFTIGTDATEIYKITAYSQMRYLKNEETVLTQNETSSKTFTNLCNKFELENEVITKSSFIPPEYNHDKKSLFTIIQEQIEKCNVGENKQYLIYDDFGTLKFNELSNMKTDFIIGDELLLLNYQYETSIDSETYNTIKITRDNEETGKRDVWIVQDSNNIKKWGKLQYLEQADKEQNDAQITELANNLLTLHNTPTRTMKLNCLGILGFIAGNGFVLKLERLGIYQYMWIKSITHKFTKDLHTMDMEVFI